MLHGQIGQHYWVFIVVKAAAPFSLILNKKGNVNV